MKISKINQTTTIVIENNVAEMQVLLNALECYNLSYFREHNTRTHRIY